MFFNDINYVVIVLVVNVLKGLIKSPAVGSDDLWVNQQVVGSIPTSTKLPLLGPCARPLRDY